MFSFITSTATHLSTHGANYSQLEQQGQEIIGSLRELRTQQAVDFFLESQLIRELQEVERRKNFDTLDVGTRVAYSGAKSLIPGGELSKAACNVLVNTAEKSRENQKGLGKNLVESIVKEGDQKIRGAILSEAQNLATNVIGTATIVAAAPAILVAGGIAIATNIFLDGRCKKFGLNLGRGIASFGKQSLKFIRKDQSKSIIESFQLYDEKKVELKNTKAEKKSKKSVITLARSRLETYQRELGQAQIRLESSRSTLMGRLVFRVNRSNGFYGFLTSLFCMLSSRFKEVKRTQDATRFQILNHQDSIRRESSNLRILETELRTLRSVIANIKVVVGQREQDYLNTLR